MFVVEWLGDVAGGSDWVVGGGWGVFGEGYAGIKMREDGDVVEGEELDGGRTRGGGVVGGCGGGGCDGGGGWGGLGSGCLGGMGFWGVGGGWEGILGTSILCGSGVRCRVNS